MDSASRFPHLQVEIEKWHAKNPHGETQGRMVTIQLRPLATNTGWNKEKLPLHKSIFNKTRDAKSSKAHVVHFENVKERVNVSVKEVCVEAEMEGHGKREEIQC